MGIVKKCPFIVAPRGEFSEGALQIKYLKKALFITVSRLLELYSKVLWQASSKYEAADIKRIFGERVRRIFIAPDIFSSMPIHQDLVVSDMNETRPIQLIFISRISPKKNLDFVFKLLEKLSIKIELDIYGEIDDAKYWERCKRIKKDLPENIVVRYHGPIEHSKIFDVFAKHDIFILPTHGENYGHVIIEALSVGVPVLISDQTPWQDVEFKEVGWIRSLMDINGFISVIEQFQKMSLEERKFQRIRAMKYAQGVSDDADIIQKNKELFTSAFET
jgi:glycosyltransferase involved in cell wall biosynthesis